MSYNFSGKLQGKGGEQISISYVDYLWTNTKSSLLCFESEKSGFWQNLRNFVTETLLSSDSSFWIS